MRSIRAFSVSARQLQRPKFLQPRFAKTVEEAAKPALQKPQPITKPFGYEEPIFLNKLNEHSISETFSKESRERRQKEIDYDLQHSPFYDSKSFANTHGKIFLPPISFFKQSKSLYFPNFEGYTLLKNKRQLYDVLKNKVTILRMSSAISGENCTNSYVQDYLSGSGYEQFKGKYPHSQIVDINIPQSWIKGLFVSLAKNNIRNMIPPARHDLYFVLSHKLFTGDVKRTLKCDNACSGYLYILDETGKIRWATSGMTDEEESAVLWRSMRALEKELIQSKETEIDE